MARYRKEVDRWRRIKTQYIIFPGEIGAGPSAGNGRFHNNWYRDQLDNSALLQEKGKRNILLRISIIFSFTTPFFPDKSPNMIIFIYPLNENIESSSNFHILKFPNLTSPPCVHAVGAIPRWSFCHHCFPGTSEQISGRIKSHYKYKKFFAELHWSIHRRSPDRYIDFKVGFFHILPAVFKQRTVRIYRMNNCPVHRQGFHMASFQFQFVKFKHRFPIF